MREFADNRGDKWPVAITLGIVKQVQDLLGVDIGQPLDGTPPFLTRFDTDVRFKGEVLCVLCAEAYESQQMTAVDFAKRLDGPALQRATAAFYEELTDFFQSLGRPDVVAAVEREREVIDKALGLVKAQIDGVQMGEMLDAEMEKARDKMAEDIAALGKSGASMPP